MKRMTFLFLLLAACSALTACSERALAPGAVAPVADPLLGVWERTETIRLPSVQDASTDDHPASSGEQQLRWVFEETTWQLTQTVTSADTTSIIRPGLIYTSSGRWRWHEATLELLRQSGRRLSRDGLWSDLPREIIALEVVVFGDVARLGRHVYDRKSEG